MKERNGEMKMQNWQGNQEIYRRQSVSGGIWNHYVRKSRRQLAVKSKTYVQSCA